MATNARSLTSRITRVLSKALAMLAVVGLTTQPSTASPVYYNNQIAYVFAPTAPSFDAALATARGMDGDLPSIHSQAQQNFLVANFFSGANAGTNVWLGLRDTHTGDGSGALHAANFTWTDGSPVNYTAWSPGEPNNLGGGEYFTVMNAHAAEGIPGRAGLWTDNGPGGDGRLGLPKVLVALPVFQAIAAVLPHEINLGAQHVGDSRMQELQIANNAAPSSVSPGLTANFGPNNGDAINNGGGVSLLSGGSSNNSAMAVGVNTSTSGAKSGEVTVNRSSDGSITTGVTTSLGAQSVTVSGFVFNYATPGLASKGGAGILSGSGNHYTLDLGTLLLGAPAETSLVSIFNQLKDGGSAAYTDSLSGGLSVSDASLDLGGTNGVSGIGGGSDATISLSVLPTSPGSYRQYLTFTPSSDNAAGLGPTPLGPMTVEVVADVLVDTPEPATFSLLFFGLASLWVVRRRRATG